MGRELNAAQMVSHTPRLQKGKRGARQVMNRGFVRAQLSWITSRSVIFTAAHQTVA